MQAFKQIVKQEEIDLDIAEVTLLSEEEYKACEDKIPVIDEWWWLRSPSDSHQYAANVNYEGSLCDDIVSIDNACIRPALHFINTKSSNLEIGDNFILAGHSWTVISQNLALCDESVMQSCFRKNWRAEDANIYKKSDVKKNFEKWAVENKLIKE